MENSDTGILLNDKNIKLHRIWFKQMCHNLGINVIYRTPIQSQRNWNFYGELDTYYNPGQLVSCIFDEHPTERTMRKLGWNHELSDTTTVIHVPYDLEGLEVGCLFIIPSGLDKAQGRVFRVIRMTNLAIYPASISCELAPVWVNTDEKAPINDFRNTNFNLLQDEEKD